MEPIDEVLDEWPCDLESLYAEWLRLSIRTSDMEDQLRAWMIRHGHDPETRGELLPDSGGKRLRFVDGTLRVETV